MHNTLVKRVREKVGKKPTPTVGIIDSQSVNVAACFRNESGLLSSVKTGSN